MGLFESFHRDIFSTHENQCGSCAHSSISSKKLECYCNERRATYKLNETKCRYYEKDNGRDYYFWKDIYTYHISTAICYILGIKNESIAFEAIKQLREQLENDESKKSLLELYDVYGPRIAECMRSDPNSILLCEELLTTYICKTSILVKEGKIDEALRVYSEMVIKLFNRYKKQEIYSELINGINFQEENVPAKRIML